MGRRAEEGNVNNTGVDTRMRITLVTTSSDPASQRIATHIAQQTLPAHVAHIHLAEDLLTLTKSPDPHADLIIFFSRHQAKQRSPSMTLHSIGILTENHPTGGLVPTQPHILTHLYREGKKKLEEHPLTTPQGSYQLSLEATHHGPLIPTPSIFAELGTHEEHWQDSRAAAWLAEHVITSLATPETIPKRERVFLLGGNHYCASAEKIIRHADLAGCLAKHEAEKITIEVLRTLAAWYDILLLDWDNLPGGEKQRIATLLTRENLRWEKLKAWRKKHEPA